MQVRLTDPVDSAEGAGSQHGALLKFRLFGYTQHGSVWLNARRVQRLQLRRNSAKYFTTGVNARTHARAFNGPLSATTQVLLG